MVLRRLKRKSLCLLQRVSVLTLAFFRVMRAAVPIPAVAVAFVLHFASVHGSVVGPSVVGPL